MIIFPICSHIIWNTWKVKSITRTIPQVISSYKKVVLKLPSTPSPTTTHSTTAKAYRHSGRKSINTPLTTPSSSTLNQKVSHFPHKKIIQYHQLERPGVSMILKRNNKTHSMHSLKRIATKNYNKDSRNLNILNLQKEAGLISLTPLLAFRNLLPLWERSITFSPSWETQLIFQSPPYLSITLTRCILSNVYK